jgi:acyl-CoA hydrolase
MNPLYGEEPNHNERHRHQSPKSDHFMTLQNDWTSKVSTADDAVRLIPKGHRILIGSGAAEPVSLVEAMVAQADHFADNEVVHLLTLGPAPYVRAEFRNSFRHMAFFVGPNVREAVQDGRADFIPGFLSEFPSSFAMAAFQLTLHSFRSAPLIDMVM